MKRLAWMAALAVALVVTASYGWNPQREEVRAQEGGGQSYSLPLVMRMPTLTPTATATPTVTPTATAIPTAIPTIVPPTNYYPILASVASDGAQREGHSRRPALSANGRYISFSSEANELVPGEYNNYRDVFLRDILTQQTTLISVAQDGSPSNNQAGLDSSISPDGRFVAFDSLASNLVPNDTNQRRDVFVRDLWTGNTSRVSINSTGEQGNGDSFNASISADGRYIAFVSKATNFVNGSTSIDSVYLHDREVGTTISVSRLATGYPSYTPYISGDGNVVAYSVGMRLDAYAYDRRSGQRFFLGEPYPGIPGTYGGSSALGISADGRFAVFISASTHLVPNDTNGVVDVFVRDLHLGETTRVSVATDGAQGNAPSTGGAAISADGRFVTFASDASTLVSNDFNDMGDIFVRDLWTNQTKLVSIAYNGAQGLFDSAHPSISDDGRFVGYDSWSRNLVPSDVNLGDDVFLQLSPLAP